MKLFAVDDLAARRGRLGLRCSPASASRRRSRSSCSAPARYAGGAPRRSPRRGGRVRLAGHGDVPARVRGRRDLRRARSCCRSSDSDTRSSAARGRASRRRSRTAAGRWSRPSWRRSRSARPIVTPLVITTFAPHHTLSPTRVGPLDREALPGDRLVRVVEAVVAVGDEAAVGEHAVLADLDELDGGDLHAEVEEAAAADADPAGRGRGQPDVRLEQHVLAELQPPLPQHLQHVAVHRPATEGASARELVDARARGSRAARNARTSAISGARASRLPAASRGCRVT